MGLSIDDFSALTPAQFDAIYAEWRSEQDNKNKGRWEQTRYLMWAILKPYSKKKTLKPTDILSFPWDKTNKPKKKMTKAEREESLRELEYYNKLWSNGKESDIRN